MRAHSNWPLALALAAAGSAAGCSADGSYIVVTVETRPAVRDVATLKVTLSNGGTSLAESVPVGKATFPATFSVSPEGRAGDLGIDIEALDPDGATVGRGAAQSTADALTARVMIDPTDYVINTDFAGDQQLSNYFSADGFQLAALADGTWTAVYNAPCSTPCNVFARRFDAAARPVTSTVAAGTTGFPMSTKLTTSWSTPAVASAGTTTVAVWNHKEPTAATYSIECRALDAAGAAAFSQRLISTDELPLLVSVTSLPNGNFAAVWDGKVTNRLIRSAIISPTCTLVGAVATVSQNAVGLIPERSHAAANGGNILYAWLLDGAVHARVMRSDGTFATADTEIIPKTATESVEFVRVAPLGAGFGLVARWVMTGATSGPGRLDLYRLTSAGALMGAASPVSTRSGSDFASSESFGVAGRADGSVFVVWHACLDKGDGAGCGVFGRLMRADGTPGGDELNLASTTTNDQTGPSAVALPDGSIAAAWTDRSGAPPDSSGTAVRARILYPDSPAPTR